MSAKKKKRVTRRARIPRKPVRSLPRKRTGHHIVFATSPPSHTGEVVTPGRIHVSIGDFSGEGPFQTYKVVGADLDEKLISAFKAGMRHFEKHANAVQEHVAR